MDKITGYYPKGTLERYRWLMDNGIDAAEILRREGGPGIFKAYDLLNSQSTSKAG